MTKMRLSATVEAEWLEAGRAAVAQGRADNISAWVNEALRRQADHDRRMLAMDEFIGAYEAEQGEITEEEMRAAKRRLRARAVVVRTDPSSRAIEPVGDAPPTGSKPASRQRRGAA